MLRVTQPLRLELPWEALEGMIKGISAIDFQQMTLHDMEEAGQFLLNYGFDIHNPADQDEIDTIRIEALSFIERRLLDQEIPWQDLGEEGLSLSIPTVIAGNSDIRELLILASEGNSTDQRWACAVLKVMHTICHINNTILYRYFEAAKSQILNRYYRALSQTPEGAMILGATPDLQLEIQGFEVKDEKSRDSLIMKLLCKRENVAEEVFDMIGVRIITRTTAEALMALEILRLNKIIIFPNIIPSRSRNALIDFDEFKVQYQEALEAYQWGHAGLTETLALMEQISTETPPEFNPQNSSTHVSYHSIHITERQLIRFKPPGSTEETRFFFPYELQILDEASYIQNHAGSSAHVLYKQKQLIQARRRVLGPLFITLRKGAKIEHSNLEPEPLP
jgi:uncharacterized protein (TIGR04562 family)